MFIRLNAIKIFAYHGIYAEEIRDGNSFEIDLEIELPEGKGNTDAITDTLDYTELYKAVIIVSESRRYNLLEAFASDICTKVLESFSEVLSVTVNVRKMNPPIGGDIKFVEVGIRQTRSDA
jgi:dihydroneopterin aldolase